MAIDLSLTDEASTETARDTVAQLAAEEDFERAASAWFESRRRFEALDASRLSPATRAAYDRILVRIGLWADAQFGGEPVALETDGE